MTTEPTDINPDAGPSAAPPPVPPPLPEFSARAVARRPDAGMEAGEGGSMPVLEAFQKFLDAERRRARNRMLLLSAAFAGVLLIVIAAGIAAALSLMRPVQAGLASLQQDINGSERRARAAARKVDDAVVRAAQKDRKLLDDIGRDRQAAAEAQAALQQQAETMKADMERTRETLRQLQQDNQRLRKELSKELSKELREELHEELRKAPVAATPSPPAPPRPEPPAAPAPRRSPRLLELSITPAGEDEGVPWRVSVPE